MKSWLLIPVLLGCALAAPPTELRAKGGVIYNDAAMDSGTVRDWVYGPALTFEVRAVTVPDSIPPYRLKKYDACEDSVGRFPDWRYTEERGDWYWGTRWRGEITETKTEWRLYVTQTIGDTVRRFRVGKLDRVNPKPRAGLLLYYGHNETKS